MCDCNENENPELKLRKKLEKASKHFGMSPEELEMKIRNALQNIDHSQGLADASSSAACVTYSYKIPVIKGVIDLKVEATYCGGADWRITVAVKIVVFGETVATLKYTLSPGDSKQCLSMNVGVAKADICLEVKGNCLYISGKACYYDVFKFKWVCESFNEKLFCF